jgi:Ca2+:H+ antiporter
MSEISPLISNGNSLDPQRNNKHEYSFLAGCNEIILKGPLNILLLCIPASLTSYYAGWADGITFVFSVLALAPLAERLGYCTEQLALHTNPTIGGLLNATFGNATELIVAIAALVNKLYRLVQLSLLGSIFSNLLLVLGSAFFVGGIRYHTQHFSKITSRVNMVLLMLAAMGLLFPSILVGYGELSDRGDKDFSRGISVMLFCLYGLFLYYQVPFFPPHIFELFLFLNILNMFDNP